MFFLTTFEMTIQLYLEFSDYLLTLRLVNSTTSSPSLLRRGRSSAISVRLLPSLPRRGWGW